MVWMSLISMMTVTAPAPSSSWACELAPAYGQGSADEGRIDDLSILSFGCGYRVYQYQNFSLWPAVTVDTQNWTIHREKSATRDIRSYSVQDLGIGVRASYEVFPAWSLNYEITASRGKGNLKKILSTDQSAENESHNSVSHESLSHALGVERMLTNRLSLSFGVQRLEASQSWKGNSGSYTQQLVDSQNHLTLTEGSTNLVGRQVPDKSHHQATNFKLGLRMYFD